MTPAQDSAFLAWFDQYGWRIYSNRHLGIAPTIMSSDSGRVPIEFLPFSENDLNRLVEGGKFKIYVPAQGESFYIRVK